jgi:hypothetical protein
MKNGAFMRAGSYNFILALFILLVSISLIPTKAYAQIWIGQIVGDIIAQQQAALQEHNCMTGTPMPDREITETKATALSSISGYWQAVQNGQPANVAKYFNVGKKSQWAAGKTILTLTGLSKVQDPFAQKNAEFNPVPLAYLRSGDGSTVHGIWQVRDSGGSLIGTYNAMFKRTGSTWLLSDLHLLTSSEPVYPLVQYCHKRDDVLPYRLQWSEHNRISAERRAIKLEGKANKAETIAAAVTGANADILKQAAEKAKQKAEEARTAAAQAVAENDKAKADTAASDAAKKAAQLAVGLS